MTEVACVYTSLFGGYEELLRQPIANESDLDLICFTDDPELESDSWRIEVVEPALRSDPARSSRFPKICAHRFLGEYDASLHVDNSVLLLRPLRRSSRCCSRSPMPPLGRSHTASATPSRTSSPW